MAASEKMTINDIAKALGVSTTTISRTLSGKGRISESTRKMVLDYINQHNYTPNMMAKGLATQHTYNIGFIIPGDYSLIDIPFFQKCLFSISETASLYDYDVIVSTIHGNNIAGLERLITNNKVDGIILGRTVENDPSIRYLQAQKIPFVTLGTTEIDKVVQIDNDHYAACKELTSLLLLKGIGNLGLIGGSKNHVVNHKRYDGYVDAHIKHEKNVNYQNIYLDINTIAGVDRAVDDMLSNGVHCIICMDDSICHLVINKLSRDNLLIPQDIKIASFYDSSLLAFNNLHGSSITSIKFDIQEMGSMACKSLIDLMNNKQVPYTNLLSYNIVLNNSTKSM